MSTHVSVALEIYLFPNHNCLMLGSKQKTKIITDSWS